MNQRSENSYPNTLNASLDIRRRSSFICKFVAPSAKSRHSSSPTALAPNFYPSSEVWGHGQQAYACSRSAVVASAVAPISCSQSLFVIVAAVVPMPASARSPSTARRPSRPFLVSVRSDRRRRAVSSVSSPFFRLSHLGAAS